MPRVSVCLPTYNGARYLDVALESILCQSFEDFELVICDDASSDNTFEIIESYAQQDNRIRFYRNEHSRGLFANYNRCLLKAEADLLKPFAQDDILHPDMLKRCVGVFENEPEVVLTSVSRGFLNDAGQTLHVEVANASQIVEPLKAVPGSSLIQECLYPLINFIGEPSTVMFRSRARGDGFDTTLRHLGDIEYWLRILMEGDFFYIPDDLCYFRWHDDSSSAANARGLHIGTDLMRIAKKFSWVFEAGARSEEEFIYASMTAFGEYVQALFDAGTLSTNYIRDAFDIRSRVPDRLMDEPIVNQLVKDLVDFRELAFHALRLVDLRAGANQWTSKSDPAILENHKVILRLEDELRSLLQSRSWHITRGLRELRRATSRGAAKDDTNHYAIDEKGDILNQQAQYVSYLRDAIKRVKLSRSWRLTKPLRDFDTLLRPGAPIT